jgi:hypothetical protein
MRDCERDEVVAVVACGRNKEEEYKANTNNNTVHHIHCIASIEQLGYDPNTACIWPMIEYLGSLLKQDGASFVALKQIVFEDNFELG